MLNSAHGVLQDADFKVETLLLVKRVGEDFCPPIQLCGLGCVCRLRVLLSERLALVLRSQDVPISRSGYSGPVAGPHFCRIRGALPHLVAAEDLCALRCFAGKRLLGMSSPFACELLREDLIDSVMFLFGF